MRGAVLAAILAIGVIGEASAQRLDPELNTAGDLAALCGPGEDEPRRNQRLSFCEGFIAGSGLLYLELRESGLIKSPWACNDTKPPLNELRERFVAWAKAHPDRMSATPTDGFWRAMADSYPCPTKTTTKRP